MLQQLLQIKKIKKLFSILLLVLGVVLSALVNANVAMDNAVDDLYQVTISMPGNERNEKDVYFQNGLKTVLQRITGTQAVLENQTIWSALEMPMSYVQQFSQQGNQLIVQFSSKLVNELVLENGFTVWGQNRPTLILWLGVAEENQRRIVGAESHPALDETLGKFATSRGLQLVLPLMDLIDMEQVTTGDLWGQFPSVMTTASERYGANAILIGKVVKKDAGWEGHWELLLNQHQYEHTAFAVDFENVVKQGLSFAISELQTKFAVKEVAELSEPIFIDMRGIYSATELSKVETYLNGLDQLKAVSIKEIVANKVIFEIIPQGHIDKNLLSQIINMDEHFISVPAYEQNKNVFTLTYRWASE